MILFLGIVLLLNLGNPAKATQADKAPINAREFKALCWFYRAATKAEEQKAKTKEFFASNQEWVGPEEALKRIAVLATKLNETTANQPIRVTLDEGGVIEILPRSRRRLQSVVESFRVKVMELEKKMKQLKSTAESDLSAAIEDVAKAKFGEAGEVINQSPAAGKYTSGASRTNGCKTASPPVCNTNDGITAGCSIMHDMFCLCLPGQSSNSNYNTACGVKLTGVSAWHATTLTGDSSLHTTWAQLKGHCEKMPLSVEFTVESLRRGKNYLESLLGAGLLADSQGTLKNLAKVLGWTKATSGDVCKGDSASSAGLCVDYGAGTETLGKILWLEAFDAAATKLEKVTAAERNARSLDNQAKSLVHSLETVLIQANISDVREGLSPLPNFSEPQTRLTTAGPPEVKMAANEGVRSLPRAIARKWFALATLQM